METNRRFTIMTFPQYFDGDKKIKVNILLLPRNQNPFNKSIEGKEPAITDAPAFVDTNISFSAKIVYSTEKFPNDLNFDKADVVNIDLPNNKKALFTKLADADHFNIENLNQSNADLDGNKDKANDTRTMNRSVKKYLPESYRQSFNFIAPKLPGNGVTDDSYHCAVRDAKYVPGFQQTADTISWGKVFGYILRNPLLAKEAGFIYYTELEVDTAQLENGGWLHIDLADDSDYKTQQTQEPLFIKKYAARIPGLKAGQERQLFAANLFPVLIKSGPVDPAPEGNFDNIFIEAADYDDGFAKILHSFQPVSQNLLAEKSDGFHPTMETGIRLGWDDEQILQWYVRQMSEDPSVGANKRIDSPNGVFGYRIDVKEKDAGDWESLNEVQTKDGINPLGDLLQDENINSFKGELPFQVYPSTLDGDNTKSFWLPMYFASWNGHSMVLPDKDAISIYQHDEEVNPDFNAADPDKKGKTNVTGSPKNQLLKIYESSEVTARLRYGGIYDFRVRMMDITHGGPLVNAKPMNDAVTPTTRCHFRRYVAPSALRIISEVPFNNDGATFNENVIEIKRPLLGYPSVAFCNRYADPVGKIVAALKQQINDAKVAGKKVQLDAVGLADPDVQSVEITVEVQALQMDYQLSTTGKESFAVLYKTTRKFNDVNNEDDYENSLSIDIQFQDANVLHFGDAADLGDLVFDPLIENGAIVLPTARSIRITIRAVCEEKAGYYGLEKNDVNFNTRYGRTSYITLYKPSENETGLYNAKQLEAIYLQPDDVALTKNIIPHLQHVNAQPVLVPDCVQRIAQQLKIENNGLSLVGKQGQRIQFGCSARIRHTLAPDNSALTFASKADLYHHWLCCITLDIKRDWTWDAWEDLSFIIKRTTFFEGTPGEQKEEIVGEIDIKHAISFTALQNPDRSNTTLIFIDAAEPKKETPLDGDGHPIETFPDITNVIYTVTPKFKKDHGGVNDGDFVFETLRLPVTINPVQIPKIASAGIALSPYRRNEKYSSSEPRRRFLWIEFEDEVHDPNDIYFARVLAYAPDQLISNNNHYLEKPTVEPPLNIDPEYIRVITDESADDNSGINAMQPMEQSLLSKKHYLLPLPPGLNESSPELFGFFTYEFRLGHTKIWSTAQARYGRALKATGIQHPAPTLTCAVNRDEQKLYVSAPYATAVFNGRNVTADPPRTQIWCLLYAQVKQADNNDAAKELKDYRNVLLDDRIMLQGFTLSADGEPASDDNIHVQNHGFFNDPAAMAETMQLKKQMIMQQMSISEVTSNYINITPYKDLFKKPANATKTATTFWANKEVNDLLMAYGLPVDLPLSILCVEMFTNITKESEYRTRNVSPGRSNDGDANEFLQQMQNDMRANMANVFMPKPLSTGLGNYRILRTSPLCEVPFICCTE